MMLSREQVEENLKPECNFLLYGQCQSNGCLTRGGWRSGPTAAFEPTCHTRQLADTDAALRERVQQLEKKCDEKSETIAMDTIRFVDCTNRIKVLAPEATSLENGIEHLATLTTAHQQAVNQLAVTTDECELQASTIRSMRANIEGLNVLVNSLSSGNERREASLQQAVEALAERDAKIVMLYEEIGHKDSRIKAFQIAIDRTGKWGGGT